MNATLPIDFKPTPEMKTPKVQAPRESSKKEAASDDEFENAIRSNEAAEKEDVKGEESFHAQSSQTAKKDETEAENAPPSDDAQNAAPEQQAVVEAEAVAYSSLQEMLIALEKSIQQDAQEEGVAAEQVKAAIAIEAKPVEDTGIEIPKELMVEDEQVSQTDEEGFSLDQLLADANEEAKDVRVEQSTFDAPEPAAPERPQVELSANQANAQASAQAVDAIVKEGSKPKIDHQQNSAGLTQVSSAPEHASHEAAKVEAPMRQNAVKAAITIDEVTLKAKIQENITVAIREGRHQVQIRLDPPELGKIFVKLDVGSKDVNIHMMAENPHVKEAVDRSIQSLKQSLGEQGLDLGNVNVGVGGEQQWRESFDRDNEPRMAEGVVKSGAATKKAVSFRVKDSRSSTIDHLV